MLGNNGSYITSLSNSNVFLKQRLGDALQIILTVVIFLNSDLSPQNDDLHNFCT